LAIPFAGCAGSITGSLYPIKNTNFDHYLEEQLQDPAFAARFEHSGEAWDVALQIAALRQQAGLSQKELAKLLQTSQQTDQPPGIR